LSADEREAVMIGSFRFEGGAQKTLEQGNLFASGQLSKSTRRDGPFYPLPLSSVKRLRLEDFLSRL
jgi:hypothetical protein